MNKQNLLSLRYLISCYITYFIKLLLKVAIPAIALFVGCSLYSVYLDKSIDSLGKKLVSIEEDRAKYDKAKEEIEYLKGLIRSNDEKLEYVQSLQGDFSEFDILMSYLINLKPYDLAIISIEDLGIVPPPDKTGEIVEKESVSDILNGSDSNSGNETSTENEKQNLGQIISTEIQELKPEKQETEESGTTGTAGTDVNTGVISSEDTREEWNSTKFDNSLIYTRDISLSSILIRGYGTDIQSVAEYVESISKAPEIEGYTLEGVEDKFTVIEDTNIVLFEIKLKMRGVLSDAQ